jgi:hypothetical protein
MSEPSEDVGGAWEQVGERISALGRSMRSHMASGEEASSTELRSALQRLGDAVKDLVDRADQAVRDPEVRDQAKDLGRSLDHALSRTFERAASEIDDIVQKVRQRGGRASGGEDAGSQTPPASGGSATDAPGSPGSAAASNGGAAPHGDGEPGADASPTG